MGRCSEFVRRRFGFPVSAQEHVVAIGAGGLPLLVMNNNPDRVGWVVFNLGASIAYMGLTSGVTALNGSQLAAGGGAATASAMDEGEYTTFEQYSMGAGATTLYILEFIGQ